MISVVYDDQKYKANLKWTTFDSCVTSERQTLFIAQKAFDGDSPAQNVRFESIEETGRLRVTIDLTEVLGPESCITFCMEQVSKNVFYGPLDFSLWRCLVHLKHTPRQLSLWP